MKKLLASVLATAFILSMAGCGGASSQAPKSSAESTAPVAATAPSAEKIVVKIGHVEAEDRSTHRALLELEKELEGKNPKFDIQIFPNGVLGGDVQLSESASLGTIQIALPSTSVLTMYSEEFGVLDMPFLFNSAESAFAALDGDLGKKLDADLAGVGIVNLGYTYNGPRCMTNSKHPINEPADLAGMKMRVMESPVFITLFETLGANATPMSFSELFTGLQQKTVDAQENPPSLIYASRFQEVQKYLSLSNHVHNCLAVLVNEKFYTGLSAEDKAVFDECIKNYVANQRAMELKDNNEYIEKLRQDGMEVNDISPENHQKFVTALAPMYDQYKEKFGQPLFDLALKYNK